MGAVPVSVRIPGSLLPSDGRFGCGPSKVRPAALFGLAGTGRAYMGTSHRQAGVRSVVASIRTGLGDLFGLPDGYEVVLGVGGSSAFWDAAAFCLVEQRSQHLSFGEFGAKFAAVVSSAPFVSAEVIESPPGTHGALEGRAGVDLYAHPHNETSTGVAMAPARPSGADADALMCVDGTSAAGGLRLDASAVDVYYFAPQKGFASDGGLWLALCSPRAVARLERVKASGRWVPPSLDLSLALENSRLDQTNNTPALATLFLLDDQLRWMLGHGGLEWAASRCDASAEALYGWAESSSYAAPFVAKPDDRSHVVGTVDLDEAVPYTEVCRVLRDNGIVDIEPYRKLGRNQLRVGMFPAVEPADVAALTACIDYVVERL
ncbi:MAG TPA: phosphoserine transaminase [Acidimicrobiales bacterium]|nr:phosphoserine transaminase [Acidimicrobiales bacterium]